MESVKKYIVALLVMVTLNSCSMLIRDSGLESSFLQKNKGKERNLALEVSIFNDTIFANDDARLEGMVTLKYLGDGYYYFKLSPLVWRMDGGVAIPNAFLRTFYYGNEKCGVKEDFIMHNEHRIGNCILRPKKHMKFEYSFDVKRLYRPEMEWVNNNSMEYGEYQMELYYITEFQDTIRSNRVSFWYFEKKVSPLFVK